MLITARFASGLASGGFAVAFAVAADISSRDNRARVMGIVGAGFSAGIILGPALGGLFGAMAGEGSAFAAVCRISALMNLLAAAATLLLLPETRRITTSSKAAQRADRRALLANPAFYVPVLVGFGAMTCVAMMEGTFVVYAERVLALSSLQIGMTFAIMGSCSVLVQASLAGRLARRFGEYRMLLAAMAVQIAGLLVLGSFDAYPIVVAGTIAISVGYALLTPAVSALASFAADDDTQGTAQGVVQGASSFGRVLGPASAGPIYDTFGPTAPFLAGGAQLLLVLILASLWRPARTPREQTASA
jgi:predicted MFS family arabinose efflux permease